jgi:hypothetical protein
MIYQLLMGRDVALDVQNPIHAMAQQMENFCYVIEHSETKTACIVDAAWDVE